MYRVKRVDREEPGGEYELIERKIMFVVDSPEGDFEHRYPESPGEDFVESASELLGYSLAD